MTVRFFLLLALAMTAACSSTATRFWTIEPASGVAPAVSTGAGTPVQIAAVHVPLAIDRLEVVQHDATNRVQVLDFDRWSAPPGDLIRRALTQDLVARLPPGSVVFPDASAPAGTRSVVVDMLDLRRVGGEYIAQMSWSVTRASADRPEQLVLRAPAGAGDVAAQTEALGRITAALADAIARWMSRPRQGPPSAPAPALRP